MNEISRNNCLLCSKTETDLIEIETNSVEINGEIVEFGELFEEVLDLKVNLSLTSIVLQNI
jgi:hypothetical protein